MPGRIYFGRITQTELEELQQVMVNIETVIETLRRTNMQSAPVLVTILEQSQGKIAQMLARQAAIATRAQERNQPRSLSEASQEGSATENPDQGSNSSPGKEEG